jgi:hypothetical protein
VDCRTRDYPSFRDIAYGFAQNLVDEMVRRGLLFVSGGTLSLTPAGREFLEAHPLIDDNYRDFRAFARAFEPGPLTVPAYLVLLNLAEHASKAVVIVSRCLDNDDDMREQTGHLLLGRGALGWRPQLVGCFALLATTPDDRPLDALAEAVRRPSWVSPQMLATMSLANPSGLTLQVERSIVDRGDAKSASAFAALSGSKSPEIVNLASQDSEGGNHMALRWRDKITRTFDEAGLSRSW